MKLYQSEVWLREQYVVERRSCRDIADDCGVAHVTIYRHLRLLGIPTRSRIESVSRVKKPKKKTQTTQEFILKLKELDKAIKELEEVQELEKALRGEESNYTSSEEVRHNLLVAEGKRKKAKIEKLRGELANQKGKDAWHAGDVDDQLNELQERFGGKI